MKKKAQKFSFVMMIVFFLTGIALTIVAAVTLGSISLPSADFDDLFSSSLTSKSYHPLAKFVFPTILGGLVLTCSITAIWASVLEHFKNVEKTADSITGKEELPDSAYSYIPAFIENLNVQKAPAYPPQYPQQFAQPPAVQPGASAAPAAPAAPVPAPADTPWICPNCGTTNAAGTQFCSGCGNRKG